MATLAQKATDGRLSFVKYVTDNKRLPDITFEIEKNMESGLYVPDGTGYKISGNILKAGTQFKIIDTKLYAPNDFKLAKVKTQNGTGFLPISKIRKPTAGNGTIYEDEVVDAINEYIIRSGGKIDIKVGTTLYKDMAYAVKVDTNLKQQGGTKGDPKADIIICKDKSNPLKSDSIFISHKKEGGPEAFQQYGGLSKQAGDHIYNHKLVQEFFKLVANTIGESNQLDHPIMMTFKDAKLSNMSIYGPEFGNQFSLQHTQVIAQGKPIFPRQGDPNEYWKMEFSSHMSLSGDLSHFTGGYEPVFGATFRAGRGFDYNGKRYSGARLAIYPKKLMESRSKLLKVEGK